MSSQFTQRRECRAAAFQYLYAWSVNQPANLGGDLQLGEQAGAATGEPVRPQPDGDP